MGLLVLLFFNFVEAASQKHVFTYITLGLSLDSSDDKIKIKKGK